MRLRVLSEAECYTRCYGGRRGERVSLVKIVGRLERQEGESLRRLVARREAEKAA